MKHNYKNKFVYKKAFTLIELLIVIAIIGILFIVLVSKVDFATDKAKATGVQTDFRSFQMAFDTVAKENAGFNTFGWDTGDANQDGIRNSYDEGDNGAGGGTAKNGIQDGDEVFTGHKVYAETFTKVFSLKKNGTGSYDRDALNRLETAINANLDPKLHITIADDGTIGMANGAQDPWNKEYHGAYITNAETDGKDRGAIIMYSDGANNEFGSEHQIANGVVSISIPGNNKYGKDDYALASVYTYINGYGEINNVTTGFSNNQVMSGSNNGSDNNNGGGSPDTPVTPDTPDTPEVPDEPEVIIAPGLYTSGQNYAPEALITPWQQLIDDGIIQVENGSVKCLQRLELVGDLLVPNDGSVTAVADKGFYECAYLTDIRLPNTVISLGIQSFEDCIALTNVVLPDSITSIGKCAFQYCRFSHIELPDNLTDLGLMAFAACSSLTEITIPDKLTDIEVRTFHGNGSLTKVTIGKSVTTIDEEAFYGCNISELNMDNAESLTTIGTKAFYSCKVENLIFPNNLNSINNYAFYESKLLKTITFPDSLTMVSISSFANCSALETVDFGNGVKTLSQSAFEKCVNLKAAHLGNSIEGIGAYAFRDCTSLEEVSISKKTTGIGIEAFKNCTALKTVTMPTEQSALDTIFQSAFENCTSLERIEIPMCYLYITSNAFKNCINLEYFSVGNISAITGSNVFDGCTKLTSIEYGKTLSTWNKVSKSNGWNDGSYITEIHCTDSTVVIE